MGKDMRKVYMDYAATTPVDPRVMEAMQPFFTEEFGNTMALYALGQESKLAVEESRETMAKALNGDVEDIVFTGSATESNNLAIKGVAFANRKRGKHIIISAIEHPCVKESSRWLEKVGFETTTLPVNDYGLVDPADVEKSIRDDTILCSVMHGNNEIGTIEPIKEIGDICAERDVYFHTDAVQTFGRMDLDAKKVNFDLLTASSHKMYGPKGAALLYVREGTRIDPILHGGGHEFGLRSSTVNVPAIVGFARSVEICIGEMKDEWERLIGLRDRLIEGLLRLEGSTLNGHPSKRLANNVNISFSLVEGESIVMLLDTYGVSASTGSACSSAKLEPSHVLRAIGLNPRLAHGSLRLSLGRWIQNQDIDYVLLVLLEIMGKLGEISPFKGV